MQKREIGPLKARLKRGAAFSEGPFSWSSW